MLTELLVFVPKQVLITPTHFSVNASYIRLAAVLYCSW